MRIAHSLNASLKDIFPKLPDPNTGGQRKRRKTTEPPIPDQTFLDAGIDPDPRQWTIKIGFEGGREFFYRVSASEKERVSSIIWNSTFDFIVFDTRDKRVAINRTAVNYCNFLFDIGLVETKIEKAEYSVVVHFLRTSEPVKFSVDPDETKAEEDDEGFSSQLQNLFFYLDGGSATEDEILWFDDVDDERVFLRAKQILALETPLLCCEPELWRSYMDNWEDDEEDEVETGVASDEEKT